MDCGKACRRMEKIHKTRCNAVYFRDDDGCDGGPECYLAYLEVMMMIIMMMMGVTVDQSATWPT